MSIGDRDQSVAFGHREPYTPETLSQTLTQGKADVCLASETVTSTSVERGLPYEPRSPESGTSENPFIVDWDFQDAQNPYNWSRTQKWIITMQVQFSIIIIISLHIY